MDVLLVNPRFNGQSEIPPLGLECLAPLLLRNNHSVSILDLDLMSDDEAKAALEDCLDRRCPKIVGVTSLSDSYTSAARVCERVKAVHPGALTILGGVHATVTHGGILNNLGAVDLVVRGEGEESFAEVSSRYLNGMGYTGVDGISFRVDGKIVHNADREMASDLDRYPLPAHHLVENDSYKTRSLSSSRGCYHQCVFCSIQEMYGHTVRLRSIEKINAEIKSLIELGARRIMFTDDNFTFSLKRVRELSRSFISNGWNEKVEFYAEGRMDDISRNPLMASMLSDAGIRGIYAGAESGSTKILDYYCKGLTPEDVLNGVSICVEQNITPVVSFILLGPRDNLGTLRETIGLARRAFEMGAEIAYTETLIPYPGTPIQKELEGNGRFRETGSAYYFQSYEGVDLDRFFRICDMARELASLLNRDDRLLEARKTYYELTYLDEMLAGKIPGDFSEYQRMHCSEEQEAKGGDVARLIMQGIQRN